MTEAVQEAQDVQGEVTQPAETQASEPEAQVEQQQPETSGVVQDSPQERNWKAARARMEEQRQEILALQAELGNIRTSIHKASAPKEEEPEFLTDSERKLYQHIKTLEQKLDAKSARDADAVVDRLRGKFDDFDEVLHPDNVAYLKQNEPELAESLQALADDPYKQGLAAYKMLKRTNWFQERDSMTDKAKAAENAKKPASVQAVRKQGALHDANRFANGLTPELKKALLKEMAEARKGA